MMMKTLTLIASGMPHPDIHVLRELEANDQYPRVTLYGDRLNSDLLDGNFLKTAPQWRRWLYRFLPVFLGQVLEAWFIMKRYDAVISWGEKFGLPLALLMKVTGRRVPHVGIFGWPAKGEKALLLKLVHSHCDRLIMWSTVQKRKVIDELGVPAEKIDFIKWPVDQKFFRPMQQKTDMICAVGSEMRDYPTLLAALERLNIPCHIAAGTLIEKQSRWVKAAEQRRDLPGHVTVDKKTLLELRKIYARSRFVVIPLHETETDNGVTCILEAFAMGKPVICSRTTGQQDVIEEGVTGIFVPVGNVDALAKAIQELWHDSERVERMGKAARQYIERFATLDQFAENVASSVARAIADRAALSGSISKPINGTVAG